jgi:hypothetical protein
MHCCTSQQHWNPHFLQVTPMRRRPPAPQNTTNNKPRASITQTSHHRPHTSTQTSSPSTNSVKLQLPVQPPAKMAKFPTDVAARFKRTTLSCAVDHVPDALLYKSTALETAFPASNPHETATSCTAKHNKQQAPRLNHANVTPSPTRINPNKQPLNKQRATAITCVTPRKDGQVPNRCRSKLKAHHTELRSRPCARYSFVQVHNIGNKSIS